MNLEADVIGKYVARLTRFGAQPGAGGSGGLTLEKLQAAGLGPASRDGHGHG